MPLIDYRVIADAISFYEGLGYEYIEVPWSARGDAMCLTTPNGILLFPLRDEFLLASGEQIFIQMMQDGELKDGERYMCVTPCFRDEPHYTPLVRPYFLKVELIVVGSDEQADVDRALSHAESFFNRYLPKPVERLKTDIGIDIMYNDVELGSYGLRDHPTTGPWVYATGVAEPRFSQVLARVPKGYSARAIPKGRYGQFSKILEEVEELEDALEQGVDIMSMVELSDLYGAMEGFVDTRFPGFSMEDIKKMSAVTKRAFRNGYRS